MISRPIVKFSSDVQIAPTCLNTKFRTSKRLLFRAFGNILKQPYLSMNLVLIQVALVHGDDHHYGSQ
jgi:hypothetical protein